MTSNFPEHDLRAYRHAVTGPSHPCVQQHTPPTSDIGSPDVKTEDSDIESQDALMLASVPYLVPPPPKGCSIRLPSIEAFVRGVEATARLSDHTSDHSQGLILPNPSQLIAHGCQKPPPPPPPPRLLWSSWRYSSANSFAEYSASEQRTVTGLGVLPFRFRDTQNTSYGSPPYDAADEQFIPRLGAPTVSPRHDTSPDVDSSQRTSQKYTIEQGDFIIYARHDRKLNWSSVVREFAIQFGNTPQRTIQGLQAWHYRINNQIPVWDEDGWLCFDHDDDEKPRQISIKARERHMYLHPGESLGIASRYPERAVNYTWVDPMTKLVAKDWGM
ncbi:hypothetical protein FDENT_12936 [Fusarium denticulatum]|uniref:Uncharacterized protein n=1 Tax=Fusarium denticulatum TaxID=48507 RepID=A0A8H5WNF0_9HYPO|nr:hypothetical protein FDENT_12936 [Fusarium denticulatum]